MFNIAFDDFQQKERIIVIPVNTSFDMIVEDPSIPHPLISSQTIHGRFILQICDKKQCTQNKLNKEIQKILTKERIIKNRLKRNRFKGNKFEYPVGTSVLFKYDDKTTFLLFALSRFDDNNNAIYMNGDDSLPIDKLIDTINCQCQNIDVFMPLMGTGLSHRGLDGSEAFHIIMHKILGNPKSFSTRITIVIDENSKNVISIFK